MQPTQGQLGRGVPLKALEGSKRRDLQKGDEAHLHKFPQAVVGDTLQGITAKWNRKLEVRKAKREQDICTAKEVKTQNATAAKMAPSAAKPMKAPKATKAMQANRRLARNRILPEHIICVQRLDLKSHVILAPSLILH